ncbi:ATP-dependent RNA helicase [Conoideocrella luteorostrata]|uniref:RNA helicase n=1 Tax=Conoideocrella luteorostrata TaxID=1105319 RepID=A0AAJ0CKE3_9HYPO|nr:ATP-dependent RNA helicase [Conoideocrella luteorostrata]
MVPPSNKRKVPPTAGPEPKRNKNLPKAGARQKPKAKANGKSKNKAKAVPSGTAVFDASTLAWESVGDDFGGLQVISGVDVVKDGERVQYIVKDDKKHNKPMISDSHDEDGSFQGFSDDAVEGENVDSGEAGDIDAELEGKKSQKKSIHADKEKKANDNKAQKKSKQQKIADKKLQKSASHGKGNEFMALAEMEDREAQTDDLDMGEWVALNLSPSLVSAVAELGFTKPTAIQCRSIPEIIAGEDVIGKAQTGSGKTLAFGIPIIEKWLETCEGRVGDDEEKEGNEDDDDVEKPKKRTRSPMALVLSPTRELAKQIGDHIKAVCDGLPNSPYVCVVTGGLSIQKQQRQLEKADIVIGTPGRLWEVLDGDASLQEQFAKIKFLVVDEADRLFKAGQFKEAENIIGALDGKSPEEGYNSDSHNDSEKKERQTLVFSATFDKDLQTKLAGKGRSSKTGSDEEKMAYLMKSLKFRGEPKFIDVNPVSRMADNLREGLIECGAMEKDLYLYTVLLLNPGRRTLIFTNSISAVRRITPLLQNLSQNALPLHSQMIQKARLRSLEKFTASRNSILVATDVAARGLDIKDVDQVIHYHVPRAADTYIHRSGRTARADRTGASIILCSPDEVLPTRRLTGKVHAERAGKRQHFIESLPIDRKIASRLKPRLDLAKKIADSILAKEKAHSNDTWLRNAADDLGVEYDSDEFEATTTSGWGGGNRGGGRRRKEKEAQALTKAEMGALKAQLRHELSQRVNLGVSERYITGGRVDIAQLLKQRDNSVGGIFLGGDHLGLGL